VVTASAKRRGFQFHDSATDYYTPAIDTLYGDYEIGINPDQLPDVSDRAPYSTWSAVPLNRENLGRFEHELLHCENQKSTWWWIRIFMTNVNSNMIFSKLINEFIEEGLREDKIEQFAYLVATERQSMRLIKCWEPLEEAMVEIYRAGFSAESSAQLLGDPIKKRYFKLTELTSELDEVANDYQKLSVSDGVGEPVLNTLEEVLSIIRDHHDDIQSCPISLIRCYPNVRYSDIYEDRRAWEICRTYTELLILRYARNIYAECGRTALFLFGTLSNASSNPVLNTPIPAGMNVPTNRFLETLQFVESHREFYHAVLKEIIRDVGAETYLDLLHNEDSMSRVIKRATEELLELMEGLGFEGTVISPNQYLRTFKTSLMGASRAEFAPHERIFFDGLDAFRTSKSPTYVVNTEDKEMIALASVQDTSPEKAMLRGLFLSNTLVKWEFVDSYEKGVDPDIEAVKKAMAPISTTGDKDSTTFRFMESGNIDDIRDLFSRLEEHRGTVEEKISTHMERGPPRYSDPTSRLHPFYDLKSWVEQGDESHYFSNGFPASW